MLNTAALISLSILLVLASAQSARAAHGAPRRGRALRGRVVASMTIRDFERRASVCRREAWQEGCADVARQSLIEYYAKRGFYHTKVTSPGHRSAPWTGGVAGDLVFKAVVEEGPPCIITRRSGSTIRRRFKSPHVMLRFKEQDGATSCVSIRATAMTSRL